MSATRKIKNRAKELLFVLHKAALHAGAIVLPNHYYTNFPDVNLLAATKHLWAKRSALVGIDVDPDAQAERLRAICGPYEAEVRGNPHYRDAIATECGPGYGYIEAQALHCVIRTLKPARIVEVGSGVSTYCMLQAAVLNQNPCEITCVEPYPRPWLRTAPVTLIEQPAQATAFGLYESLSDGDFLFIDSSHTVKTGSDANYLILEVLPRLRPGVTVHLHDVYLPYDYPRDALRTFFQWQETALLHAFLTGNAGVMILFCLSQLHYDRPAVMKQVFPDYSPQADENGLRSSDNSVFDDHGDHFPSSIYLRTLDARVSQR